MRGKTEREKTVKKKSISCAKEKEALDKLATETIRSI